MSPEQETTLASFGKVDNPSQQSQGQGAQVIPISTEEVQKRPEVEPELRKNHLKLWTCLQQTACATHIRMKWKNFCRILEESERFNSTIFVIFVTAVVVLGLCILLFPLIMFLRKTFNKNKNITRIFGNKITMDGKYTKGAWNDDYY